jgi:outer membrane protein OmpA-like peptidoglycan-associated protein
LLSDVVEENFYNLINFNFDTFTVKNKTEKELGKVYVRLDDTSVTHQKEVI